jgi:hypothetical protein
VSPAPPPPITVQGAPPLSLKPRPSWKPAATAALVLVLGGLILWKGVLGHKPDEGARAAAMTDDPTRRFHVFVKSDPPGADIFFDGGKKPIAATPVTIPIDLNGVSSRHLLLKKEGFEDYEQIVVNDTPLSIALIPVKAEPAPPTNAGNEAPAPADEAEKPVNHR